MLRHSHLAIDGFPSDVCDGMALGLLSLPEVQMNRIGSMLLLFLALGAGTAAAQDAAAGAKLFVDQKCSLCHSVAGKGNAKGPLDDVGSKLSAADIRAWIADAKAMTAKTGATRKPEMKAYTLEKADVDSLVAYLVTLKKK
jgi:mono/diheme cytochrome c family protein